MNSIPRSLAAITEDRRADYLWNTKDAARVLGIHPNKFGTWWYSASGKLLELLVELPGATSAELARLAALAEQERQRRAARPKRIAPSPVS